LRLLKIKQTCLLKYNKVKILNLSPQIYFKQTNIKYLYKKQNKDKNIFVMKKSVEIINLTNQSIRSVLQTIDNFIVEIQNEKLKKLCAKVINDYETILDELKLIMKSYKKELEDIGFFEKYQNLISLKIAKLNTKTTFEIAKNLYLSVVETIPDLYNQLIYNDEELEIVNRLIKINEEFIENLKQFFVINEEK